MNLAGLMHKNNFISTSEWPALTAYFGPSMHHENTVCTRQQGHIHHNAGEQYCFCSLDQFCVKPGLETEGISILFRIFLPRFVQLSDFSVTSHFLPKVGRKLTQTVTFEQNSIIEMQGDGLLNKFLIS